MQIPSLPFSLCLYSLVARSVTAQLQHIFMNADQFTHTQMIGSVYVFSCAYVQSCVLDRLCSGQKFRSVWSYGRVKMERRQGQAIGLAQGELRCV